MGLFSGILGFFGARSNNKRQAAAQARDSYLNSPAGWRAEGEAHGFNPLFVAGKQLGAGYSPVFENAGVHLGNAVEAGLTALDRQKIKVTQLKNQNQRLNRLVEKTTFDINTTGVYDRGRANVGQASGTSAGNVDGAGDIPGPNALRTSRLNGDGVATSYDDRVTAPALTVGGVNFHGSGAMSSGQAVEDALGDNPLSWIAAPAILGDMLGHTIGNYVSSLQQKRADAKMDEWFRRSRDKQPIGATRPRSRPTGRIKSPSLSGGNANDYYQSLFN